MIVKSKSIITLFFLLTLMFSLSSIVSASVTSVSCPISFNIVSGQTSSQDFKIVGTGGSVEYRVVCDKGSQTLQPSPPQALTGGQLTITGTFGLTTSQAVDTTTCTFSADDLNNPSNKQSCVFAYSATKDTGGIHIQSPMLCTPDAISLDGNGKCITKCKSDGSGYVPLKCCDYVFFNETNIKDAYGGYYCSPSSNPTNNTPSSNSSIWIIAGAIIVGFIILAVILSKRKKR